MKGHVSFWTVKSIFGHHEHLWDGDSHKPPNLYLFSFFSFIYLFWTNDAVVLFSLSTFAEQVSNILQFPSVYNFPLHLHTYFLIYTDDKILPNKFVLKSCLILVACNSDFFWLSIWWMTTQLVAFDDPCLCWRKECSCLSGLFYKLCYSFPLLCFYPSNIFQHTRKMFMNRLLFMVCQCSLKWFCEQKKHFPSIATLFILNQILNTEFSILDVRFENWGISLEV